MKVNRIALLGMTAFGLGALSVIDIEGMFSKDDPRYESSSGFSSFNTSGDSTNQRTGQSAQGNFKQHQGTDYNSYTKFDELLMMLLRFQEQSSEKEQNLREMFTTQLQQLIGVVKELKQQNENIQKINEEQKHRIDGLEKDIAEAKKDAALLEQMRHNKKIEDLMKKENDINAALLAQQQAEAAAREVRRNSINAQMADLHKKREYWNGYVLKTHKFPFSDRPKFISLAPWEQKEIDRFFREQKEAPNRIREIDTELASLQAQLASI